MIDSAIEKRVRSSFERQAFMTAIGASLSSIRHGEVEITLQARPDLTQQHGFLHAAVVTAILDSASGYAALTTMQPPAEVLSVEFKVNLLRPATGEHFIARARVKRAGRTLTVTAADCFSVGEGTEKLVATMLGTMIRSDEFVTT